jgi:LysM repeat protein
LSTSDNDLQSKSSVTRGVKYSQSLRVKRDGGGSSSKADRSGWSLGNMAKALGTGVVQGTKAVSSGVVQGTKAVGSGVVQGTKAVGSGVVQGSIVVGSGVVQGSKAVGTGVVQGTKAVGTGVVAAGRMTKDVTIAVGKGVYQASEDVVNAAVTGVSAAGEATVTAGRVVTNVSVSAVNETTKWVKEQSESFGGDDHESYTVLPGDTLDSVALDHGVTVYDLIRLNTLYKRALIPGKQLLIPDESDQVSISSNLPFPVTGAAAKWSRVFVPSKYILRGRKEPARVEQLKVLHSMCRLLGPYSQNFIFFLT